MRNPEELALAAIRQAVEDWEQGFDPSTTWCFLRSEQFVVYCGAFGVEPESVRGHLDLSLRRLRESTCAHLARTWTAVATGFGNPVIELRQQWGMSQREFAECLRCSVRDIRRAEQHEVTHPRRVLRAICSLTGRDYSHRYAVSARSVLP